MPRQRKTKEQIPVRTEELQIGVIKEDRGVIALDKPAGMDTFQTFFFHSGYPALYDAAKEHWPDGAHAHRIDRTTSGLHMYGIKGKSKDSGLRWIVRGWSGVHQEKIVHKSYLAVVDKVPKWEWVDVRLNIKQDVWAECTTRLWNLRDGSVQADLVQGGRTHQVRRACQAVGIPIVGDRLYGGVDHDRIMLHNWKCTVDGWGSVQAPTPDEFPHHETPTPWKWAFPVRPLTRLEIDAWYDYRESTLGGTLPGWVYKYADPNFGLEEATTKLRA